MVTTTRSISESSTGLHTRQRMASRGFSGHGVTTRLAIENALHPARRMTAIALRPGTVESATIVSSSPGSTCRMIAVILTWQGVPEYVRARECGHRAAGYMLEEALRAG